MTLTFWLKVQRLGHGLEDNIRMTLRDTDMEAVDWINVTRNRGR
jgi:hypothetical protein